MRSESLLQKFLKSEEGQDGAEYGLLVGFIAIIIVVGVGALGLNLNQFWTDLAITLAGWL